MQVPLKNSSARGASQVKVEGQGGEEEEGEEEEGPGQEEEPRGGGLSKEGGSCTVGEGERQGGRT